MMIQHTVPSDWEIAPLGEVAEIIVPMRDKPKKFDGEIPWIRIEDLEGKFVSRSRSGQKVSEKTIKEMNLKPYPIGTVLCSCSGNMGICAITKSKLVSNQTFAGIVPAKKVNSEYLFYLLSFYKGKLQNIGSGTTISYLSREKFERLIIPIPPIAELEKIASILSKVDELIQKIEQVIEQTQRLKKGLMQRLLTKGIGHTKFKKTVIGEIPEEWEIADFAEVMEEIKYGTSVKCVNVQDGVPILRIPNIINGIVDFEDLKYAMLSSADIERYRLRNGDIILIRTNGNREYVGRCAVYHQNTNIHAFASYLIRVRLKLDKLNPEFINIQFSLPMVRKQLFNNSKTSAGQYNINTGGIKWLKIVVPPLSFQRRILSIVFNIEKSIQSNKNQKMNMEILKKGLMQKLLTGKIRVKL
jgi:type I restriction enzyme, S subunit